MDVIETTENTSTYNCNELKTIPGAQPLSALDLNKITLDINHTVLTPEYLENLKTQNQTATTDLG